MAAYRSQTLELEGRSLIEGHSVVFTSGDDPKRPRRTEIAAVDGPRLAGNVTVAGAGVREEDVAKLFAA
jgi:hypothetical protein